MNSPQNGIQGSVDTSAYDVSKYKQMRAERGRAPKLTPKNKKIIIAIVAAVIVIFALCGTAFALSVKDAKNDANTLVSQAKVLVKELKSDDKAKTQQAALDFAGTAKKLDGNVGGPLWAVASLAPVYGSDIRQVRALASAANNLSTKMLLPIVDGLPQGGIKGIVENHGFNVDVIRLILSTLGDSADDIAHYASEFNSAGEVHIAQLKEPMETAKSAFNTLNLFASQAPELAEYLPAMLGADGLRNYLVLACNNSEVRSTGGMPGQFGILEMNNGHMEMSDFAGIAAVPTLSNEEKIQVPEVEERLFGTRITRDVRDVNFIPDFARVAELEKAIWEKRGKRPVAGAIGVDPIFLQRMLGLVGGITTSAGIEVNGENAAEIILNSIYLRYGDNNAATDAFFSEVANLTLSKLFDNMGSLDIVKLFDVLVKSAEQRHFYMWMQSQPEESIIQQLGFDGIISDDPKNPTTGLYFGSAMGCKIFWYLDVDVDVSSGHGNFDGTTSYDVKVTFKNLLSQEAANALPFYIRGNDPAQRNRSDMPLDIYLYAPAGGKITNMQTTGFFQNSHYFNSDWNTRPGDDPMTPIEYNGFEVWFGMTQILGNEETTLSYTVTTSNEAKEPLVVDMTPLPNEALQESLN